MTTNKLQIESWLKCDKAIQSDYMLVVCDTFDHQDYPVYVFKNDLKKAIERYSRNMQKVMEVYDLSFDIDTQLNDRRAWNT